MLMDDAHRTTHDDGRQLIVIGHLSDSGDSGDLIKIIPCLSSISSSYTFQFPISFSELNGLIATKLVTNIKHL